MSYAWNQWTIESIGNSLDYLNYWFMKKVLANGLRQGIKPETAFVIPDGLTHPLDWKIHLSFVRTACWSISWSRDICYIIYQWVSLDYSMYMNFWDASVWC